MTRTGPLLAVGLMLVVVFAGCAGTGGGPEGSKAADAKKLAGQGKVESVFQGTYKMDGSYSYTLAPGPHAFSAKTPLGAGQMVEIPSKALVTNPSGKITFGLWLPDVPEGTKIPVIMDAGPYYGNGDVVATKPADRLGKFLIENFVPYGYAVAQMSVRGTGSSGGCMDLMGKDEQGDIDAAVTWLGTQPWSNGNVGMIGRSYDGSTPWEAATFGNEHLKTIVPISGLSDFFDLMVHNGTSESRAPGLIHAIYYVFPFQAQGRSTEGAAWGVVCPESYRGFATAAYSTATGDRFLSPAGSTAATVNDFYYVRNFEQFAMSKYKGSIFAIHGLQDWNVEPHMIIPLADTFERHGTLVKQLYGQWDHSYPDRPGEHKNLDCGAQNDRWDWAEIMLHWFDHELKGLTNVDTGPAVQVMDDQCRWRNEEHFPPRDANWTTYHLGGGNKLTLEQGQAGSILLTPAALVPANSDTVKSLPGYSADFVSTPLATGMQISGLPRLHLTVTPHSETGGLAGWLYDVDQQGKEKRIAWTSMDLHYAGGGDVYTPYVPDMPLVAKMQFEPMDAWVQAGHKLLVRVWESSYSDHLPNLPPGPVTLNYGGATITNLYLPIVTRDPSDFFQPPQPAVAPKAAGPSPTTAPQPDTAEPSEFVALSG